MQRRVFIQLSAGAVAALTLPLASGCSHAQIDIESQPFFFSHLANAKTIIETGQAYLKANPGENDKNKLKGLLLSGSKLPAPPDDNAIKTMLAGKVTGDFKLEKNIVTVSGWVLSVTEARQCALFSILQS